MEHALETVEDRGGGPCMRIRVQIDITKPLCRGRKILLDDNTECWVSFQYERLPNFCYWCGSVSHGEKDCSLWLANTELLQQSNQQFGPQMRAVYEWGIQQTTVKVEGHNRQTPNRTEPENGEGLQHQTKNNPLLRSTKLSQ